MRGRKTGMERSPQLQDDSHLVQLAEHFHKINQCGLNLLSTVNRPCYQFRTVIRSVKCVTTKGSPLSLQRQIMPFNLCHETL